jgi:hypothetical protein
MTLADLANLDNITWPEVAALALLVVLILGVLWIIVR